MAGIITTYSIDKDYFEVGESFRLHISTNNFRNAILTSVTDNKVVFMYWQNGEMQILELTVDDLMYRNHYDIIKLKPDYEDGKFSRI